MTVTEKRNHLQFIVCHFSFVGVIRSDTDWIGNVLQKDKTKAQMASPKP